MKIFMLSSAILIAASTAAFALTPAERQGLANAVVNADPSGTGPLSQGFVEGTRGTTARQAAGAQGLPVRHLVKRNGRRVTY